MNEVWYYEYKVIVMWEWEGPNPKEKEYSGIVPATSLTNAVQKLEDYYNDSIVNILTLKDIVESEVFEFNDFEESSSNAGFIITKKE